MFHIPAETFPYGACEGEVKGWECFFEPFSRCTPEDAQRIIEEHPGLLPAQDHGASGNWRNRSLQVSFLYPLRLTCGIPLL